MSILIFMLLSVFGLFTIPYGIYRNEKDSSNWWILLIVAGIVAFSVGVPLTGAFIERENPTPVKSSEFEVKTEIRQEFLNGQEISRDTVYIFTPKN